MFGTYLRQRHMLTNVEITELVDLLKQRRVRQEGVVTDDGHLEDE